MALGVFISYASADTRFAMRLRSDLQRRGFHARTFLDILPKKVQLPRTKLGRRLISAISADQFFIPILSPSSIQSPWVNKEIRTALVSESSRRDVAILPVMAQQCVIPKILDLRTPSDFTRSYAAGLADLVGRLSAPSRQSRTTRTIAPIKAAEGVANELSRYLASNPNKLAKLKANEFEKFVAEILQARFNMEVQVTSSSKDAGVDIIAVGGRDSSDSPILIQCKRYGLQKRVGVEAIQALHSSTMIHRDIRSPNLLLATSSFSPIRHYATGKFILFSRDRWRLNRVDMTKLLTWLEQSPELGPDIRMPITQMQERYAELVDKSFSDTLTATEKKQMGEIEGALDEAEASFYQPFTRILESKRDELRKR